jgi:hypothetical protein
MKKSVILNKDMRLTGIEVEDIIEEEVEEVGIEVILLKELNYCNFEEYSTYI